MRDRRLAGIGALAATLPLVLSVAGAPAPPAVSGTPGGTPPLAPDPLGAEIERWAAYLKGHTSDDPIWADVKESSGPALRRAGEALRDGRRLLALQRLEAAHESLAAAAYLYGRPPGDGRDTMAFEAEWTRLGRGLRDDLGPPSPAAFDSVRPAAVRALGEAALPQVRVYYDASLEYGRNTMAVNGLFYLGAAQAQREFAAFCRSLAGPAPGEPPPLRPLGAEIDALEREFLAAYRPPLSIDRHPEFILASATLKEARELDAAGLRHGALLRTLQAAQRFAPLREAAPPPPSSEAIAARLREHSVRLTAGGIDHSIGRLFLEAAQDELARPSPDAGPAVAAVVAFDVLPRYFAALQPPSPGPPKPAARVAVTLVRWPYT
jgi:hypothetical protein